MELKTAPRSPSVVHIASTLEARIRSGHYQGGKWLPTERALAQEFHVSRTMVRSALAEITERNLVIRATGCRALVRGDLLARPRVADTARRNLALWISGDPTDMGGAITSRGIQSALDPDAFRLVVASHTGNSLDALIEAEAQTLLRWAGDSDIAGVLLWYFGGERNRSALQSLRAANIPTVFVDRRPPAGFEADYVGVQNERAEESVVRHLVRQGHRRIAHVANSELASTVSERLAGYRKGLEAAGIPFRPELALIGSLMQEEGATPSRHEAALVERLLTLTDPPTALCAVNDYTAQRLIAALRERGVRVPEDIAVAGFDDTERWQPGRPFLTTIRQPFEALGAEAARLLVQRLKEGRSSAYRHTLLDAPLVARDSTCATHRDNDSSRTNHRKEPL